MPKRSATGLRSGWLLMMSGISTCSSPAVYRARISNRQCDIFDTKIAILGFMSEKWSWNSIAYFCRIVAFAKGKSPFKYCTYWRSCLYGLYRGNGSRSEFGCNTVRGYEKLNGNCPRKPEFYQRSIWMLSGFSKMRKNEVKINTKSSLVFFYQFFLLFPCLF